MTEDDILDLIRKDEWMMTVLRAARSLELPDWVIGAGFVRNKVWDHLHGYTERTPLADIDLIYFDPSDISEDREKVYDRKLRELVDTSWSTKNQARMHTVNGNEPFTSSEDGLAHWIETPTCTGVKLLEDDSLQLIVPHGIDDLVNLRVRPTNPERDSALFQERVTKKRWKELWPKLEILPR